jgi:hypothetical protein
LVAVGNFVTPGNYSASFGGLGLSPGAGGQGEVTRVGALQSGGMLLLVKEEYDRAAANAADKMVRLAHELTGTTEKPVSGAVELGLSALRGKASRGSG